MFEYFTGPKYVWNLGVCATLNNGGLIDEVDRACRPAREARDVDSGSKLFVRSWKAVADQLADQAHASEAAGHLRTAGQEWYRSGLYVCQAERMLSNADPDRRAFYQQALDAFAKVFEIADPAVSRVEVPFEGTSLPAYFSNASVNGEPVPCVIMWNGLDSTKEHMYTSGWPQEMRQRGISVLMIDNPGSGEALRFGDLKARIGTEAWATAQVDYLESRPDVDSGRIGLVGWSLGGYYVPRAAAFEKRIKLIAVWGANHNWGEVQKKRLQREGENPVPHYWEHVKWVFGYDDLDEFISYAEGIHLNGVVDQITCPFLIAHGANDRQISVDYAHQSYDQAVHSPKRELRIFTPDEGAAEHVGLDHMPHINSFIADWVQDTIAELGNW
ncbi:alpha/beta hydrolase family protein [Flexivirga oryzae]|uniref:Dienelactone hydrolase n=1 Tax=Flexivirga oryzae TaxID=1794944 RepID=A0A839N8B4_9MICO|nr:alpha/beta fold hydrolase [Flexivirga oryzae]MBB2891866.1 dienelactone hydrolase [Flexivirga oryzae]